MVINCCILMVVLDFKGAGLSPFKTCISTITPCNWKQYVELLCEELQYLSLGTYRSERLLVFCSLMLQRDRLVRKGCDIRRLLERRMKLWRDEQFDVLLQEAVRCDQSLRNSRRNLTHKDSSEHLIKVFTRLMLEGNVRAAVRWLTERSGGGILKPTDSTTIGGTSMTVVDPLGLKRPDPCVPPDWAMPSMDNLPFLEDSEITGSHILSVAHQLQGGAGPGGCDASHWRDVLLRYGSSSARLRDSVAGLCRRLCNSIVPWDDVRALMACRLIALNKCPGVRPIGIGETLRRVIGKAICLATRLDAALVCGSDQLCAGLQAGIEGAIHAMNDLFTTHQDQGNGWGVLLVDAANAFNSLNRAAMLLHARVLWPRCARFLFNTYRGWSVLVLKGSSTFLYSKEGVTQGDPLSMFMYAIGTLPLIRSLHNPGHWTQLWYADDASAGGTLFELRDWFNLLCSRGPAFGYYPEPTKSFIVVSERWRNEANAVFGDLGIQVVTGHRFLGGFIGSHSEREEYVVSKVRRWVGHINVLAEAASTQPQLAYAALTKSLQHEWNFLLRVVPQCSPLFHDVEMSLCSRFLPAMFGLEVSAAERRLFALPLRLGGLGICNPVSLASHLYDSSVKCTEHLIKSIVGLENFELDSHFECVAINKVTHRRQMSVVFDDEFGQLLPLFDSLQQRAILRAKDSNISSWLSVLPLARSQFDLSAQEFRDGLALRYKKPLLSLPSACDGCGAQFSIEHALDCRFGGLVGRRHNEVRDAFGDLASLVWSPVIKEPVVRDGSTGADTLIADLCVRGVWEPQTEALFDIRVVDTDARSYRTRPPRDVLSTAEGEKKRKYLQACQDRHATFTPLCVSVDGMLGSESEFFVKRLSDFLAAKWERPYSVVIGWVRARLSFAILRAALLCVRGSRTKWRGLGIVDGASLPIVTD